MLIHMERTMKDNNTIVQPLPPLLQHFLHIVQATTGTVNSSLRKRFKDIPS